ncbi:chemotaxis protein CheA [Geobacter sp. FeAm09]|uniref:chemotaxis protein CheA n=1 Tax=Geobacter sp. FeAm09 TaxID=2597769 RepID=UPI0011EBA5D6|nr:chemotaxis protein CheA [Geobacter sp. FeAm09]QEM69589.1 chemotaxis protein CheA [Geobacter sp. FeAm09]
MDMSQYRDLFISESRGHIQVFNELIVRLEDGAADQAAIDELFRHAHSLKGMAATMEYQTIADLAHGMEDLLSKVRSGAFGFSPGLADLLLQGNDTLAAMISAIETGDERLPDAAGLVTRLAGFDPAGTPATPPPAVTTDAEPGTAGRERAEAAPEHQPRHADSFKSVRVRTETLDRLVTITGELITTRYRLADRALRCEGAELAEPLTRLSALLRELRDEVFQARMLPFSFVADRFPRLVRDLSRKQGKEVLFRVEGKEIELDRGILEEISEPLVHILRNAVDHGMEPPEERVAAGKPGLGTIRIVVTRDKDCVTIVVSDDGRGMDPARLAGKAVARGMLSREQADALTRHEALMLICAPGFSTAETVSDISGRGVGMDAVRAAMHALGGGLAIESEAGRGSRFLLRLPISVSIIHALLVECGPLTLSFPVNAVARTIEVRREEIFEEREQSFFLLDGRQVPLRSLNRLLGQAPSPAAREFVPTVVVEAGGMMVGLAADRLLGQREIFVKPLGIPLSRVTGLTGGAITGDGRIVYVVDAAALV